MKKIFIREPIWKDRSIGIAVHEFPRHDPDQPICIEITYRKKDGKRLFPEEFMARWIDVQDNRRMFRQGVELVIVPIKDLRIRF